MEITIADLIGALDQIAPFGMAESWDNVGLIVGDRSRTVESVLIGLDPTNRLLNEALDLGADTVVTHHPAIFKPIPSIDTSASSGRFLESALTHKLNIVACHTNFDAVCEGVNDILAELLGLQDISPLVPADAPYPDNAGLGRVGCYAQPKKKLDFIELLLEVLELDSVQIAGELPDTITAVALCGGSGSEFAETAKRSGADVYISAEIKHNVARWAEENDFCVIDGTHYATEKPAVRLLAEKLRNHGRENGWNLEVRETETEHPAFATVDKNRFR
ncbi:MAG: Nif3-like dinuclear metal center hexameric protein [Desulfofustis sp.]|nr:Nif3-like dinuclear metal center hexameric protein [Desulfofustis sp.]